MKPLFIPLKTEYFNAFKNGSKTYELRFGSRWSEHHCFVGRAVVLSRGYGKHERLNGIITSYQLVQVRDLPQADIDACIDCYKGLQDYDHTEGHFLVHKIGIEVLK